MKKRIFTLFIIFLTITSGVNLVSAQNETEEEIRLINSSSEDEVKSESERICETVKANDNGYLNISFEDEYNGYCINKGWKGASVNDTFTVKNTSYAINNNDGSEIGNYIKILFVDFHDDVVKNDKLAQNVIWSFSNDYYNHKYMNYVEKIVDIANSGRVIADHGETITINNTTKATFDFEVLSSGSYGFQNFFGYKITYSDIVEELIPEMPVEPPTTGVVQNNSSEENPVSSLENNTTDKKPIVLNTTQINNTTNPEEEDVSPSNDSSENESVDDDSSNITNHVENDNTKKEVNSNLSSHTTGYSLIFAIITVVVLAFIVVKSRRD